MAEFHGAEVACELAGAKKVDFTFSAGRAEAVGYGGRNLGLLSLIVFFGAQCLLAHAIDSSFLHIVRYPVCFP